MIRLTESQAKSAGEAVAIWACEQWYLRNDAHWPGVPHELRKKSPHAEVIFWYAEPEGK